jgi:hypothetical protein
MKILPVVMFACALIGTLQARDSADRITPEMQAQLDAQQRVVAGWAANPVLVDAVVAQNKKGPISGMTNRKWKAVDSGQPGVMAFQKNAAGMWLTGKLASSDGFFREAFLNAAQGEKVAFVEKPSSYLHAGQEKFTEPMAGRIWQGKPEYDKSSRSYSIQVAAPVLSGGKPVGVLVVGVSMKALKDLVR